MPALNIHSIPIDGTLDLHTFQPVDIKDLVPEYLAACRERDIFQVRIIHGKGIGTLRRMVVSTLEKLISVESFRTEEDAGGWGATIVLLKKK
jgi:DNA-nicking Smr family endonuclease